MNNQFLEQTLARLNDNRDLLRSNMDAFGDIPKKALQGGFSGTLNKFRNQTSPNALSVNMRRTKGSTPIGRLQSGKTLYSDGTVREEEQPQNEQGLDRGFANLELPEYNSDEGQTDAQISLPQAPTERLSRLMMSPKVEDNADPLTPNTNKTAYDLFLEQAEKLPFELRKDLDQYFDTTDEDQQIGVAEKRSISNEYYNPQGEQNIAYNQPAQYSRRSIPIKSNIGGTRFQPQSYRNILSDLIDTEDY